MSVDKERLRLDIKSRLAAMTEAERRDQSSRIVSGISLWDRFANAKALLLFSPIPSEPDIVPLYRQIVSRGARLCLPRVDWRKKEMAAAQVRGPQDMVARQFGIREPSPECPVILPAEIDLVLVPGLGFDLLGHRLGRGGGFYDRFLASADLRGARCGVLFAQQVVQDLPVEPHDVHVEFLMVGDSDSPREARKT